MNNPPPPPPDNGGEFLLSLLQKPNLHRQQQQQQQQQQNQQPPLTVDPAVAAVGPTLPLPHQFHNRQWQSSNGPAHNPLPTFPQRLSNDDPLPRLGFPTSNQKSGGVYKLQFGSVPKTLDVLLNPNSSVSVNTPPDSSSSSRDPDRRRHQQSIRPPPGFSSRPRGGANSPRGNKDKGRYIGDVSNGNVSARSAVGLAEQLYRPGLPRGAQLHSASGFDVEDSLMRMELEGAVDEEEEEEKVGDGELDDVGEEFPDGGLLLGGDKKQKRFRDKDFRSDKRGQWILGQRMRMSKCQMRCRVDIERFIVPFLSIYKSLIPLEEEKVKQKQLLALLQKLVNKEWPEARLYLYGSCANSFGVSKSDIDVCLAIDEENINKSEILLKLADILESDNLQNVQALTRARVPIVKLMDPVTGISCDICINNVLAVVNTKLLRDYADIDVRLRQLAFIVKHWAKSRCVNETYQGTLSSYAYVLMCIHFLQLRRPAILPCLQGMETTYSVTVDGVECSFFDQVEKINGFGSHNRETIAHLVWGFFNYWAYRHDYANDVVSVRTGSIISKRQKDWTRRIGNDRHLICIEDPFETSHDLGRVVDKYSIRVLREEFERAAEIMQYDPNPCVTLFERYIPS